MTISDFLAPTKGPVILNPLFRVKDLGFSSHPGALRSGALHHEALTAAACTQPGLPVASACVTFLPDDS